MFEISLVTGTAGHIDHPASWAFHFGKTALINALKIANSLGEIFNV